LLKIVGRFTRAFPLTYLLTDSVTGGFPLLNRLNRIAPRFVERDRAVDGWRERIESTAPLHTSAKCVDVLAYHPQVVHESAGGNSSRE
jgi:hypothetical protein